MKENKKIRLNDKHQIFFTCAKCISSPIDIINIKAGNPKNKNFQIQYHCNQCDDNKFIQLSQLLRAKANVTQIKPNCTFFKSHWNTPSEKYCPQCDLLLCNECLSKHSIKYANHFLHVNYFKLQGICADHKESSNIFCNTCLCSICNRCKLMHTNHSLIGFNELWANANKKSKFNDIKDFENYSSDYCKYQEEMYQNILQEIDTYIERWINYKTQWSTAYENFMENNNDLINFYNRVYRQFHSIKNFVNWGIANIFNKIEFEDYKINFTSDIIDSKVKHIWSIYKKTYICKFNKNAFDNKLCTLQSGHSKSINAMIQLHNNNILTASRDCTIKEFDYKTFQCKCSFHIHSNNIYSVVQWNKFNDYNIVSAGEDLYIRVWNINTKYKLVNTLYGHKNTVYSLLQYDNNILISGSFGTIIIWDLISFEATTLLSLHINAINRLIRISNGNVVTVSRDEYIKVFNWPFIDSIHTLEGHEGSVNGVIEIKDNFIWTCSADTHIILWDLKNYAKVTSIIAHFGIINTICNLGSSCFATGGEDDLIKIWELHTDDDKTYVIRDITFLNGFTNGVNCIINSKNGKLISASSDKTIKIWD